MSLLVIMLFIIGCSDNETITQSKDDKPEIYLSVEEKVTYNGSLLPGAFTLHYNSYGQQIKSHQVGENNVPYDRYFTYNSKQQLTHIEFYGPKILRYNFVYDQGGKLISGNRKAYVNNILTEDLNYSYLISPEGNVSNISISGTETYSLNITYDNNNNITLVEKVVNNAIVSTIKGWYGDKNGVYKHGEIPFYVDDRLYKLLPYSKNNLLKQENEDNNTRVSLDVIYHKYNEADYPTEYEATNTIYDKTNNISQVTFNMHNIIKYEKRAK